MESEKSVEKLSQSLAEARAVIKSLITKSVRELERFAPELLVDVVDEFLAEHVEEIFATVVDEAAMEEKKAAEPSGVEQPEVETFFKVPYTAEGTKWCEEWYAAEMNDEKDYDDLGPFGEVDRILQEGLLWQIVRKECPSLLKEMLSKTDPLAHPKKMAWHIWFALKSAVYAKKRSNATVLIIFLWEWRAVFPPAKSKWIDHRLLRAARLIDPIIEGQLMKLAQGIDPARQIITVLPRITEQPAARSSE